MKTNLSLALLALALAPLAAQADPLISSWYTEESGAYARIYQTTADEAAGNSVTSWSHGRGNQAQPTYAGVHQIDASNDWVYIHSTGLAAGHVMGPWYLNAAKTQIFPNYPSNISAIFRFPRLPIIPVNKTPTPPGAIGYFVDGVAQFDGTDTFSYSSSGGQDATPMNRLGRGDGFWTRDAWHNEGVTFDAAMAHQAGNFHHYHVNPPALRFALGDSVDFEVANNTYPERFNGRHSPIIGWVADGLPIYGPYGYSDPNDGESPIRRMISGFQVRIDLAPGATRNSFPAWAVRFQGVGPALTGSQIGPAVNANLGGESYVLGRYMEDFDYKGDLGMTLGVDFDLNEHNVRFGVTPGFPAGTWAYFTCIDANGTPVFPYNIGREYFGTPTGSSVNAITEEVTNIFQGGPNMADQTKSITYDDPSGSVVLTWSSVEGGTYQLEVSADLDQWTEKDAEFTAQGNGVTVTDPSRPGTDSSYFYRLARTGMSPFDATGFDYEGQPSGGGGDSFTATFTGPPLPPANAIQELRIGSPGTLATLVSINQRTVSITFDSSALPSGNHAVYVTFAPPGQPQRTLVSTNRYPKP
jgi:hypothetical protein